MQLTGMGTGETDPFVLQLSYDSSLVQSYHDGMFLAWLSPTDGWTQAVDGNFGSGADAVTGATGSWDSIVDPGDLASYLGSWGVDSTTETVWAVLNHNSQFAVLAVPEPSSLLMAGMGLIGLLLSVRPTAIVNGACQSRRIHHRRGQSPLGRSWRLPGTVCTIGESGFDISDLG